MLKKPGAYTPHVSAAVMLRMVKIRKLTQHIFILIGAQNIKKNQKILMASKKKRHNEIDFATLIRQYIRQGKHFLRAFDLAVEAVNKEKENSTNEREKKIPPANGTRNPRDKK